MPIPVLPDAYETITLRCDADLPEADRPRFRIGTVSDPAFVSEARKITMLLQDGFATDARRARKFGSEGLPFDEIAAESRSTEQAEAHMAALLERLAGATPDTAEDRAEDERRTMAVEQSRRRICAMGLRGWENWKGPGGVPIPFELVGARSVELSEASMAIIPSGALNEICQAILMRNRLKDADRGN